MAVDQNLLDAVEARAGETVDPIWLDAVCNEALSYVRLLAPCKRAEWLVYADLPVDVQSIFSAALARQAANPRGIRQETIGEYSYTLASGAASGAAGPFSHDESRIVSAAAGCGGSFKSVALTSPPVLPLDTPDSGQWSIATGVDETPTL